MELPMRCWLAPLFALIVLFNATDASAATCNAGQSTFDDVPDAAIFCKEALWLRNAVVTLGCGGNNYCPGQAVTRAQMALFMNRLATTLTPDVLMRQDTLPPTGDLDTGGVPICIASEYTIPAGANGRYLSSIVASVSILTNGAADIKAEAEASVDGGPFLIVTGDTPVHVPANQWTNVTHIVGPGTMSGFGGQLPAGHSYAFRMRLTRTGGGTGTGEVVDTRCSMKVDLPVDPILD
jgi:hypothetical protein